MKNNLFIVSKNGYRYMAYALFAALVLAVLDLGFFSILFFIVVFFFIFSFRNPEREVTYLDEKAVVSPVDGIVKTIEDLENDEYGFKVLIESNYMHVGVLRVPLNGQCKSEIIYRGARTSKKSKLFYDLNENAKLLFTDSNNNKVQVLHRLKQSFVPLALEISHQKTLQKGTRYGYATNCMSEIYLPKNFRLDIKPGSEIYATHSLIGYFT